MVCLLLSLERGVVSWPFVVGTKPGKKGTILKTRRDLSSSAAVGSCRVVFYNMAFLPEKVQQKYLWYSFSFVLENGTPGHTRTQVFGWGARAVPVLSIDGLSRKMSIHECSSRIVGVKVPFCTMTNDSLHHKTLVFPHFVFIRYPSTPK